jgi:hypothetical protein
LRFAQGHVAQLEFAATSCSVRFEICNFNAACFARDCSAHAGLAVFVEMHRLRTSDAGVSVSKDDFVEECLEPATVATATRTGKLYFG